MDSLAKYLSPITAPLDQLFLDPNNPRFVGHDWAFVPDPEISEHVHQTTCRQRLLKEFDVGKLQANMEINGFLPIDRVIVRKIADDQFVVIEGNRRICAAKEIGTHKDSGEEISEDVLDTLKDIDCLLYTGENQNNEAAWIFQGLRHISGIEDWSAFHKAKLLVEQMENEGLTLTEVGDRFGLTRYGAGQWVRGYRAFNQAKKNTDYVGQVDERVYPYLQELFGRSSIALKEWLGWDDDQEKFLHEDRLNEFIGWFYNKGGDTPEGENGAPEWENRVIGKRDDLRQLSFLIREFPTTYFLTFRHEKDVEDAYSQAIIEKRRKEEDGKSKDFEKDLFDSIETCTELISGTPISVMKNAEKKEMLDQAISRLQAAIELVQ